MLRTTLIAALLAPLPVLADVDPSDWDAVTAAADGQTVFWHAWGGSRRRMTSLPGSGIAYPKTTVSRSNM